MNTQKQLQILPLEVALSELPSTSVAALLPAFTEDEQHRALRVANALIGLGVVEICCVGPNSEVLHDAIDDLLIAQDRAGVCTMWETDQSDAIEDFIFGSGAVCDTFLAFVAEHDELVTQLTKAWPT